MENKKELKRVLSLFDGANILIGIMVGSGIFYLGSYVLMRSGLSLGLSLIAWIVGGIVTLLSGLCYAELGAMMPKAGGSYVYLREAYGSKLAFISSFSGFILGSCGSTAGLAVAFATVINSLIPLNNFQIKFIAIISIVILTGINVIGVKQGAIVQNIFTVGKLIPIGIILFIGLFFGKETPSLSLVPATGEVSFTTIIGMIGFSSVATLWAYEGWRNLNTVSEEIKNPSKNIPRAISISIVIVMVLYTLFNYSLYRVIPYDKITELINSENYYLGTEASYILFGKVGGLFVGLCMMAAVFGSLNGCVLVFPRNCFAMARDGYLPSSFSNIHPKYNTPNVSLGVHMLVSIGLVLLRNLDQITSLVVFSGLIFSTLTSLSIITLRKKYPDLERPYRVKTWIVYVTITVMIGLTLNALKEDPITSLIGLIIPALLYILSIFINPKNKSNVNLDVN